MGVLEYGVVPRVYPCDMMAYLGSDGARTADDETVRAKVVHFTSLVFSAHLAHHPSACAQGHAMSIMAATSAADKYMRAWGARAWIADPAEMPPPPATVRDMYLVHDAMKNHPLCITAFGGLAGWKLGAVGVIQGEPAISAPLFRQFVVDAPAGAVSAAAINMHNLEVTPEPRACMWARRCGSGACQPEDDCRQRG
jgi:hypothetical protein